MIQRFVEDAKEAYVSNPVAVRNFRTQMRGKRAPRLWGLYAGVLVLFAALIYGSAMSGAPASIAEIQARLAMLNSSVMTLLWTVVFFVAPALAVSLVVAEYEKRSMDMILSSPISLRAFFLGKLLSAWRVVWMILILAMPVSSVCIVMGGATLTDVLIQYLAVAASGMVLASVALPIAVLTKKNIPALFSAYAAGGVVSVAIFAWTSSYWVSLYTAPASGPVASPLSQILPASVALTGCLVGAMLAVSGSSAILSRKGSKEEKRFRIQGLLAGGFIGAALGLALQQALSLAASSSAFSGGSGGPFNSITGVAILALTAACAIFLPHVGSWDWHGDSKRILGNGSPRKEMMSGGVRGGLPYLLALFGMSVAGFLVAVSFSGAAWLVASQAGPPILWGVLSLTWGHAVYWFASAVSPKNGGQPKKLGTGLALAAGFIPIPLISMFGVGGDISQSLILALAPLGGPFLTGPDEVARAHFMINCGVLLLTTVALYVGAAKIRAKKLAQGELDGPQ